MTNRDRFENEGGIPSRRRIPGVEQVYRSEPAPAPTFSQDRAIQLQQAIGAEIVDGNLIYKSVCLTPLGAEINGELSEKDWWNIVGGLLRIEATIQLLIGDLLAFGERQFKHTYREVAELYGREVETLYNYAYVASHVNFSFRNEKLQYTHYYHVAKLNPKDQRRWLELAAKNEWSAAQMRAMILGKQRPPSIRRAPMDYFEHAIFDISRRVFERTKGQSRADMAAYLRRLADELEKE